MITMHLSAPKSTVIVPRGGKLPRGFSWGAYVPQNGNAWYYVIRNRDGKSVVCHASPCADEILPTRKLAAALNTALDS